MFTACSINRWLLIVIWRLTVYSQSIDLTRTQSNDMTVSSTKVYLTPNQSMVVLPLLYVEETPLTQYIIIGYNVERKHALPVINKYQKQKLPIETSTVSSFDFYFTATNIPLLHLCSNNILYHYQIQHSSIVSNGHTDVSPHIVSPQSLAAINANTTLLWNHTCIVYTTNISGLFQFCVLDLSAKLGSAAIISCIIEAQYEYTCFTNSSALVITLANNNNDQKLTLEHIYRFQQHTCIINIEKRVNGVSALCDCHNGCYNYRLQAGVVQQVLMIPTTGIDGIITMKLSPNLFKGTMFIASQTVLGLYDWSPHSVTLIDSLVLPSLDHLDLHAIQAYQQYFQLTFKNKLSYKNIYIWYESSRQIFVPLNIVTKNLYAHLHQQHLYEIDNNLQLSCRHLNPSYLLVHPGSITRQIFIYAFEIYRDDYIINNDDIAELSQIHKSQRIILTVYPATISSVYIKQQLPSSQIIQFNQDIQIQLDEIYEWGGVNNYSYSIYDENGNLHSHSIVSSVRNHRLFSLYSLLPCVKMYPYQADSFRRIMLAPNGKLYTEQCVYQDYFSDYLCNLEDIEDSYLIDTSTPQLLQDNQLIRLWKNKHHSYMITKSTQICHGLPSRHVISLEPGVLGYVTTPSSSIWLYLYSYVDDCVLDTLSISALLQNQQQLTVTDLTLTTTKIQITVQSTNETHCLLINYRNGHSHQSHKLQLQHHHILPGNSTIIKLYREYTFVLNSTHLTKYSTFSSYEFIELYSVGLSNSSFDRATINSNYLLLIYQDSYRLYDLDANLLVAQLASQQQQNANSLVYGLLVADSSTVLIGVDQTIRSYTGQLVQVFGELPYRQDALYERLQLVIEPIGCSKYSQQNQQGQDHQQEHINRNQMPNSSHSICSQLSQKQTFTVSYINSQIFNPTKNIQHLLLPYSTSNSPIQLPKDMLMGPIFSYSISDSFSNQIFLYNHLELSGSMGNLSQLILAELTDFKYTAIAKYTLNTHHQTRLNIILSNCSHILSIIDNNVEWTYQLQHSNTHTYFQYFELQIMDDTIYVFISDGSLMLLRHHQNDTLDTYDVDLGGRNVRDYSIHDHHNYQGSTLIFLLLAEPQGLPGSASTYYINLTASKIVLEHPVELSMQSICQYQQYLFYIASQYICALNLNQLIDNHNTSTADCKLLSTIIPHQYYLKNAGIYTQLQALKSQQNYLFILHSKTTTAILLKIAYNPTDKQWVIRGCYVGISGYIISRVIGYNSQFMIMEYSPEDSDTKHVLIAYYNNNDDNTSQRYCENVANGIFVEQPNTTVLVAPPDSSQHILITNISGYTVYPNLLLMCNYVKPLPLTFLVVQGSNNYNSVNYYCRLHFKAQENRWYVYASVCFSFVIVLLIVMRLIRCCVEGGIIKWPSLSSSSSGDSANLTSTNSIIPV